MQKEWNKYMEEYLIPDSQVTADLVAEAAGLYPTPFYLYDEMTIVQRCQQLKAMPAAFGIKVRYAMKANSTKSSRAT